MKGQVRYLSSFAETSLKSPQGGTSSDVIIGFDIGQAVYLSVMGLDAFGHQDSGLALGQCLYFQGYCCHLMPKWNNRLPV